MAALLVLTLVPGAPATTAAPASTPDRTQVAARPQSARGIPAQNLGKFNEVPSIMQTTDSEDIRLIGQIGGGSNAAAVQGDYAFVGIGPRLISLDIADPASPVAIWQSQMFSGSISDISVSGDYAFAVGKGVGLMIFDISNPETPVHVGGAGFGTFPKHISLSGGLAYLSGNDEVYVVDVSEPTQATVRSIASVEGMITSNDLQAVGSYLYASNYFSRGLTILLKL